jgi:hypothetical protein
MLTSGVEAAAITALGAYRGLSVDEATVASALGIDVSNELQAMLEGMRRAFSLQGEAVDENPNSLGTNLDWQIVRFPSDARISVVVAPSENPKRRANTADTLRWWTTQHGSVKDARVLVVTSPIYLPYQGSGVIEVLGLRCGAAVVEVVGISQADGDLGTLTQTFRADHYLQEVRSGIVGLSSLLKATLK